MRHSLYSLSVCQNRRHSNREAVPGVEKLSFPGTFPEHAGFAPNLLDELDITEKSKDWEFQINLLTSAVCFKIMFYLWDII